MTTGYQTAIKRNKLSKPMRWLKSKGLLTGKVLDYGCGRGDDAKRLGIESYDPHYNDNWRALNTTWDVITCNYVLNVLPPLEQAQLLDKLVSLLNHRSKYSTIYVSVRRDIPKAGYTSDKATHYYVELGTPWELIYEDSATAIYKFTLEV